MSYKQNLIFLLAYTYLVLDMFFYCPKIVLFDKVCFFLKNHVDPTDGSLHIERVLVPFKFVLPVL